VKNEKWDEIVEILLSKKVLILRGDVNKDMVLHVYKCLLVLEAQNSPDIEIRFFTEGGEVKSGLDIYDALRKYKGRKTGIVYSRARSMGAVILQACEERVCLKHAVVLIHNVRASSISLDEIDDPNRLTKLRQIM